MYSINHPKVDVLIRLAKIIAMKVDANESILEKYINISDGLTNIVWPVYPEISAFYALLGGSYDWKISSQEKICGLNEYIESCFKTYQGKDIACHDIKFYGRDESIYDRVLGSIAGVKND